MLDLLVKEQKKFFYLRSTTRKTKEIMKEKEHKPSIYLFEHKNAFYSTITLNYIKINCGHVTTSLFSGFNVVYDDQFHFFMGLPFVLLHLLSIHVSVLCRDLCYRQKWKNTERKIPKRSRHNNDPVRLLIWKIIKLHIKI